MIVGVDIGTQSLKAVVTDDMSAPLGWAGTAYAPTLPAPGQAEQHPSLWEAALGPTIAAALEAAGARPEDVRGLGLTGQLDGCVPVDDAGRAIGPCLIWMDRRADAELAGLPISRIRIATGAVPDGSHLGAKIRWLKRHRPGPGRFHQPVTYMIERLTGESVVDHALASTSMLYGLAVRDYDPALLDAFEIERCELPSVRGADEPAGPLTALGAALTGLAPGIPVAVGTGDDFAAPLGAGVLGPGAVAIILGTGEVVGAVHDTATIDAADLVETHAYPAGGYFLENPGWLAGGAVNWLMRVMALESVDELDRLAATAPPGADGLLFLPAMTGAMAPEWHSAARGCFYGLTPSHDRAHLARAVLEGCAFAMRDVVFRLQAMGAAADRLVIAGGGARSRIWVQIRADAAGLPATVPRHRDSAPIGAAMLAGVAAGVVPSLASFDAARRGGGTVIEPEASGAAALDDAHGRYRQLFESLRPLFSPDAAAYSRQPTSMRERHAR